MSAPAAYPRVRVRPAANQIACDPCSSTWTGMARSTPELYALATTHAQRCAPLHLARLRRDVQDEALILRMRATHLESTSRETGELPFPWVELRLAARFLDELVAP